MPFELTHLAVGLTLNPRANSSYVAGLIYPDSRYPAGIERRLTHTLEPVNQCGDKEFIKGVEIHLITDKEWSDLAGNIVKPMMDLPDNVFMAGLKLIQDRAIANKLSEGEEIIRKLDQFQLPAGLPVVNQGWHEWKELVTNYLHQGPTQMGWRDIIVGSKYLPTEEVEKRLVAVEKWYPEYELEMKKLYEQLVNQLRQDYAGIT